MGHMEHDVDNGFAYDRGCGEELMPFYILSFLTGVNL